MEEKKNEIKISLSNILLFIAIIVIIVMGIIIYKLKTTEVQEPIELQSQTSSSNETVSDLQEKLDSDQNNVIPNNSSIDNKKENNSSPVNTTEINNTTETNNSKEINNSNSSSSRTERAQTKERNYKDYIGTWYNSNTQNEITIKNVTDNTITFTWFLYRLAGIDDDTTIGLTDGKAIFYFKGYDDKNFDSKYSEDEKYIRKATITLDENGVSVDVIEVESIDQRYTVIEQSDLVYVTEGIYTHPIKRK